jgi:hypothetical protein
MATRKKKDTSGVVKGNHLTVTTFSDGSTKLEWDDEALLKEVREAIASVKPDAEVVKFTKRKKASTK